MESTVPSVGSEAIDQQLTVKFFAVTMQLKEMLRQKRRLCVPLILDDEVDT